MSKRPLSRTELESLGLDATEIKKILSLQEQKKERRYKYIVLLTTREAQELSKQSGKEFIRATKWSSRIKRS